MKKTTKLKAFVLSLMMLIGLIPLTSFAQQRNDDYFRSWENDYDNRTSVATWTLTNQTFGEAPLGSGLLILTAVGAGYAISRRKRSRKGIMMILVLAMILSFTQCKKDIETITPVSGEKVHITLKVGGGSRHDVNTATGEVTYAAGDKIYVGNDGKYIGTLTCSKVGEDFVFGGDITDPKTTDYLHFYFVGGLAAENIYPAGSLTAGTTTSFTVDISDQSSKLPVLSYVHTAEYYDGGTSYTCMLLNKCALVKFTLTNPAGLTQVGDMHTEATINFATPGITPTGTTGSVKLYSKTNTEKWAILLPQTAVNNAAVTIGSENLTVDVPAIAANDYVTGIPAITNSSAVLDLSTVKSNQTVADGWTIINTLGGNYKISIAAGATVTLDGATINSGNDADWAGLTCLGDATIILADGTTNTIVGGLDGDGYSNWPGIFVPAGSTLTINGNTGVLNARRGGDDTEFGSPAGIGASWKNPCGNIVINGGVINAEGGAKSAGIGGTCWRACGDITINGGTITATGHKWGTGIGLGGTENANSFYTLSGGNITITGGTVIATGGEKGAGIGTGTAEHKSGATMTITLGNILISGGNVTATGGQYGAGIGTGHSEGDNRNNCGTITIEGGTVTATGGAQAAGIGCGHKNQGNTNSECGAITISGGTVDATGGEKAAGIGCGYHYVSGNAGDLICGDITITSGVTSVTATKGSDADNCIGVNKVTNQTTCTRVTIGGTLYWGPAGATYYYANGGDTYLTESPCVYPKP